VREVPPRVKRGGMVRGEMRQMGGEEEVPPRIKRGGMVVRGGMRQMGEVREVPPRMKRGGMVGRTKKSLRVGVCRHHSARREAGGTSIVPPPWCHHCRHHSARRKAGGTSITAKKILP